MGGGRWEAGAARQQSEINEMKQAEHSISSSKALPLCLCLSLCRSRRRPMLPLTNYELGSFSHTAAMMLPHCLLAVCAPILMQQFSFFSSYFLTPPSSLIPSHQPVLHLALQPKTENESEIKMAKIN